MRLLEFAETYEPRREFVYWVRRGEYLLLDLLQKNAAGYSQTLFNEMYLVEEFI